LTPAAWITLGFGLSTLFLNCVALAIGYGVLRGTVEALGKRVSSLEAEIGALNALQITVAKIGERQDIWIEQLKELNASIRWMREPATPDPLPPIRGVSPPRARK
jgi:hypothetical protein